MSAVMLPVREPIMLGATMLAEVARVGVAAQHEGDENYLSDLVETGIAERFERVFGIPLGDFYASIQALKKRGVKVEPLISETIAEQQRHAPADLAFVPIQSRRVKHG